MKAFAKIGLASLLGAGAMAITASTASAEIVCSGDACWHTHSVYEYPAEAHVIVHPDSWRWGDHDHYVWREHEGRGFWHGERWEDF